MAPRFGNNMARTRLLLAQRAGYLPPGQLPVNARAAWHSASKNLKRDAMQQGQPNPMVFLRNMIQGGANNPVNHAPPFANAAPMQPPGGNLGDVLRNQNGPHNISWGGQRFGDAHDLYNWEVAHGNTSTYKQFYKQHPEAAMLLEAFGAPHPHAAKGPAMNSLRDALLQRMKGRGNPLMNQPMNLY